LNAMGEQSREGVSKRRVKHPFVKPKRTVTPVSNENEIASG
jgi:hypothetical protein